MSKRTCTVDGCDSPVKGHGLCSMHYQRWKRTGTTDGAYPPEADRFWSKVDKSGRGGCWQWVGTMFPNGYGMFARSRNGSKRVKYALAHRYSYEAIKGEIPEGLVLDHLCRNRACVNPDHLEPVTHRENLVRGEGFVGEQSRRTYCLRGGHPLSGENLYVSPQGERACRTCRAEHAGARRSRKIATSV